MEATTHQPTNPLVFSSYTHTQGRIKFQTPFDFLACPDFFLFSTQNEINKSHKDFLSCFGMLSNGGLK